MAKNLKNPLAQLDLSGLSKLPENKTAGSGLLRAIADPDDTLGLLQTLNGTWAGHGFNIIEVPNMNQAKPGPPPADKFTVILNSTSETLTFSEIGGSIVNKGNAQKDIAYRGLHYLQQVSDVNLPQGDNGIHLETGLFLNIPGGTDPAVGPTIARLGSVPHGDSLLAQGRAFKVSGGPQFDVADATPFLLVDGKRENITDPDYLALLQNAALPSGIPQAAIFNPNVLLENDIQGQNITEMIVILLDANPIDGVANPGVTAPVGGITNIPFINVNANATSLSAIFWIETVERTDGSTFLQLQYTQTVILDFPVFDEQGNPLMIKWPHISVATMKLLE